MNVVMVLSTRFPPEEGIGNHVFNVSKNLVERGHSVTVITRGSITKTVRKELDQIKIIETNYIPLKPVHVWLHKFVIEKEINRLVPKPDVIHVHTPLSPFVSGSKKLVSTVHSSLIGDAFRLPVNDARSLAIKLQTWSIGKQLMSELMKRSDIVTTVSQQVALEIIEYYDPKIKPVIIGNAVQQNFFMPSTVKSESDYVLYVGRLGYGKGLFDILECAKMLDKSDLTFILVGSGELERKLKKMVQIAKSKTKIVFKGQLDQKELLKLYQNALAVIISSGYESGPLVLLEAMACGTPVISTRVGLVPDVVKNWENGIIIPFRSPRRMAEAIIALLEDKPLRRRMGFNARKSISDKYTWERVTDAVENCYNLVCESR